jgi:methionyl-tRNA synthetase
LAKLITSQACFDPEDAEWLRCTVAADVYARFLAAGGERVVSATGLEAYASRTLHEAKVKGLEAKAQLASKRRTLGALMEQLHISPNILGDTSDPRHADTLKSVFTRLAESGVIAKLQVEKAVCEDDGELFDEVVGKCGACGSSVEGLGCCTSCGATLTPSTLREAKCGVCDAPISVKRVEEWAYGLKARGEASIVNVPIVSELSWGVPTPGDKGKTFAPWFSALTASMSFAGRGGQVGGDVGAGGVHFVTKRFGTHYKELLPKLGEALGAAGSDLRIVVVGRLRFSANGKPLSVSSSRLVDHLGSDATRYALSRINPEADMEVDVYELQKSINEELVDSLGQFAQRVLQFTHSKYGCVPTPGEFRDEDRELLGLIDIVYNRIISSIKSLNNSEAYASLFEFAKKAAEYYTRQAPWSLLRVNPERAASVVYVTLEALRALSVLAQPLLPEFSSKTRSALGLPLEDTLSLDELKRPLTPGAQLPEPKPAYAKLTDKQVEALVAECMVEEKPEVDIAEFLRLDLRVASVVSAERVPNTKRLLRLRVRVGGKLRTIVSSIGEQYTPEELVGKKIVVLMNLKPSVFAGVTSRGMLLAAEGGGVISLLTPMREVEDGSWVH